MFLSHLAERNILCSVFMGGEAVIKSNLEMKHEISNGLHQHCQGQEVMLVMSPLEDNSDLSF